MLNGIVFSSLGNIKDTYEQFFFILTIKFFNAHRCSCPSQENSIPQRSSNMNFQDFIYGAQNAIRALDDEEFAMFGLDHIEDT